MNSLIFFSDEFASADRAVVAGARARYVHEWHELKAGLEIRAGIWGGNRGSATVLSCSEEKIEFALRCTEPPLEKLPLTVIAAVPRPQTVKKVIQACCSFGAKSLHFISSNQVVPSYFSSKTLTNDGIRLEMLKALEQVCDTIPLEVVVHRRWHQFSKEELPLLSDQHDKKYVADTRSENALLEKGGAALIAIGPESGWTQQEITHFLDCGFSAVSLGERMLRVEHALAKMIALVS